MIGLSTTGSISLGWALVAGRNRVPRPAAGNTALRTLIVMGALLGCSWLVGLGSAGGRIIVTVCWGSAIMFARFPAGRLLDVDWSAGSCCREQKVKIPTLSHPSRPRVGHPRSTC